MHRRHFLTLAASTALVSPLMPSIAKAGETVDYTPGLIQEALAEGKTLFVDYAADWCSTCARQERIISQLRGENPAYDEQILFIRVDWDDYGQHEVTTSRTFRAAPPCWFSKTIGKSAASSPAPISRSFEG